MNNATPEPWQIELTGSEIARVECRGEDIVVVLAAARVRGDRSQLDQATGGGHLHGVSCHLLDATCAGDAKAMFGRIDEASWGDLAATTSLTHARLIVPSKGNGPVRLSLRTGLGDALDIRAQAWRMEVSEPVRFTPSLAC